MIAVGVPVITQVFETDSPEGSVGLAEHEVTAPPVLVGVLAEIATFWVKAYGLPA